MMKRRPAPGGGGSGRTLLLAVILHIAVAGVVFATGRAESRTADDEVAPEDEIAADASQIAWEEMETGTELAVIGKLAVYGNEPHSYLAAAIPDGTSESGSRLIQVEGELLDELLELQGQRVLLRGTVTRLEIGPGFPLLLNVAEFQVESDR